LLLGKVEVKPTGDWDKWVEDTTPITASQDHADVHVIFTRPKAAG